jgi:hypothetical protein
MLIRASPDTEAGDQREPGRIAVDEDAPAPAVLGGPLALVELALEGVDLPVVARGDGRRGAAIDVDDPAASSAVSMRR